MEMDGGNAEEHMTLAGPNDQVHVQRATTRCLVPIRSLGQGAFAQVDLCHVPAGLSRKLIVRKMLVTSGETSTAVAPTELNTALKLSSTCDWTREATMHRECEGCPFVLQMLAAKRCRTGKLLLLLEYAAQGSLTNILAARKQQLEQQLQQQSESVFPNEPSLHLDANAASAIPKVAGNAAAAGSNGMSRVIEALIPLAVSAAELITEHDINIDTEVDNSDFVPELCKSAHMQHQTEHQSDDEDDAEPVFVAFMPELIADAEAATSKIQEQRQCNLQDSAPQLQQLQETGTALSLLPVEQQSAGSTVRQAELAAASTVGPVQHDHHGLPEDAAKFYAGCILMALQWMHSKRILHRDIKPCNLLLFSDGYLKLADLGCCCQLPPGIDAAQTRTGTVAYMAPEVLGQTPYSYPVDMWSLGVTIWQLVAGCLPAWAEERQVQHEQQQQQWWDGHPEPPELLLFPAHFSRELCTLLDGLLHHDSAVRLKLDDVMAADWFAGFDWQALQDKTLTPPVIL